LLLLGKEVFILRDLSFRYSSIYNVDKSRGLAVHFLGKKRSFCGFKWQTYCLKMLRKFRFSYAILGLECLELITMKLNAFQGKKQEGFV